MDSAAAPGLSVIIPTLNAAEPLKLVLAALRRAQSVGLAVELIVADGGSQDETGAIATHYGARIVPGGPGRGMQLASGAREAAGAWLFFLHADTLPGPGWADAVRTFMCEPSNDEKAAVFRFVLDDRAVQARRLEALVAWRCRVLGLPYGDQGLLISRSFYHRLGGFRPIPLMEDVDIVRRIGRTRLVLLDAPAITSASRYRQDGWIRRPLRNLSCLSLYYLGVPPQLIARLYK